MDGSSTVTYLISPRKDLGHIAPRDLFVLSHWMDEMTKTVPSIQADFHLANGREEMLCQTVMNGEKVHTVLLGIASHHVTFVLFFFVSEEVAHPVPVDAEK